ncbi:MAG: Rid family detoxifying hydrolase [Anaerolineae bacterium]|nr:Rid family detoxifying hydrolase [Anaerolineae bacterium]
MQKQVVIPEGGAKPLAPYSPGIKAGMFLYTAGQIGLDPDSQTIVEGGVAAQAKQSLENLKKILEAGGASLDSVVKVTVFLQDIADYAAVNQVYGEYFTADPPARSAVAVTGLPAGALVEIEAVALTG